MAVPTVGMVAVVCGGQPTAIDQVLAGDSRYHDAARLARCVAAGLATDPPGMPTATGAGTFRAVYDRVYGWGMPAFQAMSIAAIACESHGADLIGALNHITVAKNEWFYGDRGLFYDAFYGSQPA